MMTAILWAILMVLLLRDFIDNGALNACAKQSKRIADAAERIANALERRWEP